jgi:hypothetical protein
MWKVTHEHWKEQGGVFGRWRAERVPEEQIRAANEKLEQKLRTVLGPDRYLDYELATSSTGQQLRNFASRYDLPRETLVNAFRVQKEIDQLENIERTQSRYGLQFVPAPARARTVETARREMEKILGRDLYNSWNEGRTLKYDFQP